MPFAWIRNPSPHRPVTLVTSPLALACYGLLIGALAWQAGRHAGPVRLMVVKVPAYGQAFGCPADLCAFSCPTTARTLRSGTDTATAIPMIVDDNFPANRPGPDDWEPIAQPHLE